jgi:hypothetical protein
VLRKQSRTISERGLFFREAIICISKWYRFSITATRYIAKATSPEAAYVSSRFGSAIESNAIRQDNIAGCRLAFSFRKKSRNSGWYKHRLFIADYEDPTFDVLPNTALLMSVEAVLVTISIFRCRQAQHRL